MKKQELDSSPLSFNIFRFSSENKIRFLLQGKTDRNIIPIGISIYEAHISNKNKSHNSVSDCLSCLNFLYSWAYKSNVNIDTIILKGDFLTPIQLKQFEYWLKKRGKSKKKDSPVSYDVINRVLTYSNLFFKHFAFNYATIDGIGIERSIKMEQYLEYIAEQFKECKIKTKKRVEAGDLTDEEIEIIENYLNPENRIKNNPKLSKARIIRDYLFWRLAIEFGLREGEILALRLEDLPNRESNTIRIIRIEERGPEYIDPRGKYAPRPKTLSRELGFIYENSPIPHYLNEYITKYRKRKVIKHGRKVFQWIMDQPAFLILSHHNDHGTPLSISTIQDIAADIRKNTGVDFHWHLARHAFFNRAYAEICDIQDKDSEKYEAKIQDLVYWGGWESSDSLQMYVNTAKKKRASGALSIYGNRLQWNIKS